MEPPNQDPAAPKSDRPTPQESRWGLDEGDLRLIRWMLSLKPAERLEAAEGFANDVMVLRNGRAAQIP